MAFISVCARISEWASWPMDANSFWLSVGAARALNTKVRISVLSRDLQARVRRQVSPLARRHLRQGHATDADALHGQHCQTDIAAHRNQLHGLYALDGEAKSRFILPADLARGQVAAVEGEAVLQATQAVG